MYKMCQLNLEDVKILKEHLPYKGFISSYNNGCIMVGDEQVPVVMVEIKVKKVTEEANEIVILMSC